MYSEKVSVVIPVYNAEKYIKDSIISVLNQTYKNIEIICIDDCSTDHTLNILSSIKDSRFFLYKNEMNRGVIYTRSRAYSLCNGEYIANMDADDISHINRLEEQVLFLRTHPDIDVVGSWINKIDEESQYLGRWKTPKKNDEIKASLIFKMSLANPTIMFRSSLKAELVHEDRFYATEDYALFCKLATKGHKFYNIPKTLLDYRILPESMSHSNVQKVDLSDNTHESVYEQIFNDLNLDSLDSSLHRIIMKNEVKNEKQLHMVSNHLVYIRDNCPINYCNRNLLSTIISRLWAKSCLNVSQYEKVSFLPSILDQAFTFDIKAFKIILRASLKRTK